MACRPSLTSGSLAPQTIMSGSVVKSIDGHEAFFPGRYVQKYPNGDVPVPSQLLLQAGNIPQIENNIIPINKLSHGTHQHQASLIQPNDDHPVDYVFKAQPRLGKEYRRTYYECTASWNSFGFVLVDNHTALLPGKYSWWGVSVEDWYDSKCVKGQQFRQAVLDLKSQRWFVAEYLQTNQPECPYGDQVFTVEFKTLLECYVKSRKDVTEERKRTIKFRFAGTLRYRLEICYVVIISMVHDDDVLKKFESIDNQRHIFDHRGLTNTNGELKDHTVTPTFKVEHMIKCIPIKYYHSWETPAFAFYFPDDGNDYELRCSKDLVTKLGHVQHVCNNNCQR